MPTYLVHGFRWTRTSIVIHIIEHDLEEAAPDWIIAPATAVTLLNSFYTLFDFLPPSSPPTSYPALAPPTPVSGGSSEESDAKESMARRLARRSTHSLKSGMSMKKIRPANLKGLGNGNGNGNGNEEKKKSPSLSPSTTTSTSSSPHAVQPPPPPPSFNTWSSIKLLEQYNPLDLQTSSQPYAYVSDYFLPINTGISIAEEINKYEALQRFEEVSINSPTSVQNGGLSAREIRRRSKRLGWFEKLKDGLEKGGDIGWFVVVCGDEERAFSSGDGMGEEEDGSEGEGSSGSGNGNGGGGKIARSATLRGFFGKKNKGKIPENEVCK